MNNQWWCALSRIVGFLFSLVLLAPRAYAGAGDWYVAEMPAVERVRSEIRGKDALDEAARQYGAMDVLTRMIDDIVGARLFNGLTAEEQRLRSEYVAARAAAASTGIELLKRRGAPAEGYNSAGPTWTRLAMKHAYDPALHREVLDRLFSESFRSRYDQISRSAKAELAGANSATGTRARDLFERLDTTEPDRSLAPAALWHAAWRGDAPMFLLFMLLVLPTYPLLALWRARGVSFWTRRGICQGSHLRERTQEWRDPVTRRYQTSTTVSEEIFLRDAEGEAFSVRIFGSQFGASRSEELIVVYAGKSEGQPCLIYSRATRRWQELYSGMRSARGSSGAGAIVWTIVLAGAVAVLLFVGGYWSDAAVLPLIASFMTFGFGYLCVGGILMRVTNGLGDRLRFSKAKRLAVG